MQSKNGLVQQIATRPGIILSFDLFRGTKDKCLMNVETVVSIIFSSDSDSDWNGSEEEGKAAWKMILCVWIGFLWS